VSQLSFCDARKPTGKQFLGACIVPATDLIDAIKTSHLNGCNPGGEVLGHAIPTISAPRVKAHQIGVLMNREQAESFDREDQS
jgi:hypothetical protein